MNNLEISDNQESFMINSKTVKINTEDIDKIYHKQQKRYNGLKHKIKKLTKNQEEDVWYPSNFLNKFIPVIKDTPEYIYILNLIKPHFISNPSLILKQLDKKSDRFEYQVFQTGSVPFTFKIEKGDIPINDIILEKMPTTDLYLFNNNLLKHSLLEDN